jgi:hypothetical protein
MLSMLQSVDPKAMQEMQVESSPMQEALVSPVEQDPMPAKTAGKCDSCGEDIDKVRGRRKEREVEGRRGEGAHFLLCVS